MAVQGESFSDVKDRVVHEDLVQSSKEDQIPSAHHDPNWTGDDVDISNVDEKKVLRKLDLRLIPTLTLLYLLSFLDRGERLQMCQAQREILILYRQYRKRKDRGPH